jgi:hypothetical protein
MFSILGNAAIIPIHVSAGNCAVTLTLTPAGHLMMIGPSVLEATTKSWLISQLRLRMWPEREHPAGGLLQPASPRYSASIWQKQRNRLP